MSKRSDSSRGQEPLLGSMLEHLNCSVCKGLLVDAVATACGHLFCDECVKTWMDHGQNTCPECRIYIHKQDIRPVYPVRSLLDNLLTRPSAKANNSIDEVELPQPTPALSEASPNEQPAGREIWQRENQTGLRRRILSMIDRMAQIGDDATQISEALRENETKLQTLQDRLLRLRQNITARVKRVTHKEQREDPGNRRKLNDEAPSQIDNPESIRELIANNLGGFPFSKCAHTPTEVFDQIQVFVENALANGDRNKDIHLLVATAFASHWFTLTQRRYLRRYLLNQPITDPIF